MKNFVAAIVSLLYLPQCHSQSINNKNYYDYYKNGVSTSWLTSSDAIHIIIDELLKSGIEEETITIGDLIKINDSTRVVATVAFQKNDKDFHFLYETSVGVPLNVKDRDFLTNRSKAYYLQSEKTVNGDVNFMRIDPLPSNALLLKAKCYWFQFEEKGQKYPIDKNIAQSILRQDIQGYLKKL